MQHFTDEAAALAYIKDELISTLQDDLYRMEGKDSASYEDEDRDEMRARIADLEAIMPRMQLADAEGFTIWVADQDDAGGTAHVSWHPGTKEEAAAAALAETAADWDRYQEGDEETPDTTGLAVLGIVRGNVEVIEWNDWAS